MTPLKPTLLCVKQAAGYLSISKSRLNEWFGIGVLPKGMNLGKRCVAWHADALDKFAAKSVNHQV